MQIINQVRTHLDNKDEDENFYLDAILEIMGYWQNYREVEKVSSDLKDFYNRGM